MLSRIKNFLIVVFLATLTLFAVSIINVTDKTVNAATASITFDEGQVSVEESDYFVRSVAIRLKDDKYDNGIRFKTVLRNDKYVEICQAKGNAEITYGVLLIPSYRLSGELTVDNVYATDVSAETYFSNVIYDGIYYKECCVYVYDIPDDHRTDDVSVRAYIKVNGVVKYYSNTKKISMAEVAYREIDALHNGTSPLPDLNKDAQYYIDYLTENYLTYYATYYDGETEIGKAEIKYKESIDIPQTLTKKGHTFTNYYSDQEKTNAFDISNVSLLNQGNINLYAGFSLNNYNLVLPVIQQGGMVVKYADNVIKSSSVTQNISVPYGSVVHLQAFTDDGDNIFSSFLLDEESLTKNAFVMPDKECTVSASFKSNVYGINYSNSGCVVTGVTSCGAGKTVKVSVEINSGNILKQININGGMIPYNSDGSGQNFNFYFTMPETDATVNVTCISPSASQAQVVSANVYNSKDPLSYRVNNLDNSNYYACLDWAYFNSVSNPERKKTKTKSLIGELTGQDNPFYDYLISLSWSDGVSVSSATGKINGICGSGTYNLPIQVHPGVKRIRFYGGTWKNIEKVYLKNSEGAIISDVYVEIKATDGANGTHNSSIVEFSLEFSYEQTIYLTTETTLADGNMQFVAVAVFGTDQWVNSQTYDNGTYVNLDENLYGEKPLYWERYVGLSGDNSFTASPIVLKGGVDKDSYENAITLTSRNDLNPFDDYKWKVYGASGGLNKDDQRQVYGIWSSDVMAFTLTIPSNVSAIKVFTGAWQSENHMYLKKQDGTVITAEVFTAPYGQTGWARYSVFPINSSTTETYTLAITPLQTKNPDTQEYVIHFNTSLTAIAFYGQNGVTMTAENAPASFNVDNLSQVKDWEHLYAGTSNTYDQKLDSEKYILFNTMNYLCINTNYNFFEDYNTSFSYVDFKGDTVNSKGGIQNTTKDILLAIKIDSSVKHIYLFMGAFGVDGSDLMGKVSAYKKGVEVCSYTFSGESPANCKMIDVCVSDNEEGILYIKLSTLSFNSGYACNISLPLVAVTG